MENVEKNKNAMNAGINEQPPKPQKGEWVKLVNLPQELQHISQTICFVIDTDEKNNQSLVQGVRHEIKGHMPGQKWFGNEYLYRMPMELGLADMDAMIDWALDAKDEELFTRMAKKRYSLDTMF